MTPSEVELREVSRASRNTGLLYLKKKGYFLSSDLASDLALDLLLALFFFVFAFALRSPAAGPLLTLAEEPPGWAVGGGLWGAAGSGFCVCAKTAAAKEQAINEIITFFGMTTPFT
jgi:hypothetical protein